MIFRTALIGPRSLWDKQNFARNFDFRVENDHSIKNKNGLVHFTDIECLFAYIYR